MIEKLSTDEYTYQIKTVGDGVMITLYQNSSGKRKEFYIAGKRESLDSLVNHMNSLTDDLCSQWFNERVKKGKTKKVEE